MWSWPMEFPAPDRPPVTLHSRYHTLIILYACIGSEKQCSGRQPIHSDCGNRNAPCQHGHRDWSWWITLISASFLAGGLDHLEKGATRLASQKWISVHGCRFSSSSNMYDAESRTLLLMTCAESKTLLVSIHMRSQRLHLWYVVQSQRLYFDMDYTLMKEMHEKN